MGDWFEESFGEDYLVIYRHRNLENASREVKAMMGWMEIKPGSCVLDVGCGMGRHAFALAGLGYEVTGLDLSPVLLSEAGRLDPEGRVVWMQGDMRCLPMADETFDAAVNWFTSFGYFEDEEDNRRVLSEMRRILKPEGRILIDFLNPRHVIRHLVPLSDREDERTGLRIAERRSVEGRFVVKRIEVVPPSGDARHYAERVRLYEVDDFQEMMLKAGLIIQDIRGNYDGSRYEAESSPRLILIGGPAE